MLMEQVLPFSHPVEVEASLRRIHFPKISYFGAERSEKKNMQEQLQEERHRRFEKTCKVGAITRILTQAQQLGVGGFTVLWLGPSPPGFRVLMKELLPPFLVPQVPLHGAPPASTLVSVMEKGIREDTLPAPLVFSAGRMTAWIVFYSMLGVSSG